MIATVVQVAYFSFIKICDRGLLLDYHKQWLSPEEGLKRIEDNGLGLGALPERG
jgi:hypothetical protein